MLWMSVVVLAVSGAEPCEAPRVRDTAPLVAAMAQDKVLGLAFLKAAGVCGERGEACDQARLECNTLLNQTIQKQVGFDEGQWLRDMLLPYNGGTYPVTRQFGAAPLAADATCNVDVATLEQAAQRRQAQAARRDAIFQEYQLYSRWTQGQLQRCKERVASDEVRAAQTKAESERVAAAASAASAAAAAAAAAEAARVKEAQEAERRVREAAEAEQQRVKEAKAAAEREANERKQAEQRAREEREQERKAAEERADKQEEARKRELAEQEAKREKEKELAEEKARAEKEEAERQAKAAEEKRLVDERDKRIAEQRAYKARLVSDAEANLKHARDEEALKKQLAVDAVNSSPAIASAAVAEAAAAERARVEAEKRLVEARQKADAVVIDDSFERGSGSALLAGGGGAIDGSFGLAVMGALHAGFWGTAPSSGMASGLELRLWGRYFATVSGTAAQAVDALLTARYFFGHVGVGVAGELRLLNPLTATPTVVGGAGPALAAAFVDNPTTRVLLGVNYLVLGSELDPLRLVGDFEVSWRYLTFHVFGGTRSTVVSGARVIGWQLGGAVGLRASW